MNENYTQQINLTHPQNPSTLRSGMATDTTPAVIDNEIAEEALKRQQQREKAAKEAQKQPQQEQKTVNKVLGEISKKEADKGRKISEWGDEELKKAYLELKEVLVNEFLHAQSKEYTESGRKRLHELKKILEDRGVDPDNGRVGIDADELRQKIHQNRVHQDDDNGSLKINEEDLDSPAAKRLAKTINEQIEKADEGYAESKIHEVDKLWTDEKITNYSDVEKITDKLFKRQEQIQRAKQARWESGEQALYKEHQLNDEQKRVLRSVYDGPEELDPDRAYREFIYNRIYAGPDSQQSSEWQRVFQQGEFEWMQIRKTLSDGISEFYKKGENAKAEALTARLNGWITEQGARENMHEANRAMLIGLGTKDIGGFCSRVKASYVEKAYKTIGVMEATHFYELALMQIRERHNGYLPAGSFAPGPGDTPSEFDKIAKKLLVEGLAIGAVNGHDLLKDDGQINAGEELAHGRDPYITDENGQKKRGLYSWEINRALSMARGLLVVTGVGSERSATSAPISDPSNPDQQGERWADTYGSGTRNDINLWPQIETRYKIGRSLTSLFGIKLFPNYPPDQWTYKEILDYEHMDPRKKNQLQLGRTKDPRDKRVIAQRNAFKIDTSIYTRTGWRIGHGAAEQGGFHGIYEDDPRFLWIGTGFRVEKLRGAMVDRQPGSREKLKDILEQARRIVPTRLYLNDYQTKLGVLKDMRSYYKGGEKDALLNSDLQKLFMLQQEATKRGWVWAERAHNAGLKGAKVIDDNGVERSSKDVKLNFDLLDKLDHNDPQLKKRLQLFVKSAAKYFDDNRLIFDMEHDELDFNWGTDDSALDKLQLSRGNDNSIGRMWNDRIFGANAVDIFLNKFWPRLGHFKSPREVADAINEIYLAVRPADQDSARACATTIALMMMRLYGRDRIGGMPFLGGMLGQLQVDASFAQREFGRHSMAWGAFELQLFTQAMRENEIWDENWQHAMQRKAGGTKKQVFNSTWGTVAGIFALFALWQAAKEAGKSPTGK